MVDTPAAAPPPLVTGRAWAVSLGATGVIALGAAGLHFWSETAWSQHERVRADYVAVEQAALEASRDLAGDLRAGAESLETAATIHESATGFVGDDVLTPLTDERGEFESALEELTAGSGWEWQPIAALDEASLLWEVLGDTTRLEEATTTLSADRDRLSSAATRVRTGTNAVHRELIAVINEAGRTGTALLSKYPSATNKTYRALKDAAAGAEAVAQVNYRAADIVADIVEARDAMASSHRSKEAAKAGPLKSVRDEVEKFARSIAGGVRIDFTWKDVVIGHGQGRSAAGTATWDTADSGYSTITLTNSIARYWNSWSGYRNLVVHEVGHAITSKCYDLFNVDLFGGDNERWATAWAIGKGYTVSAANGSELYGAPSAKQINATKKCR